MCIPREKRMLPEKICKTVQQYNREPIPEADMAKLLEIARDYRDVKNHIYTRYGQDLSWLYGAERDDRKRSQGTSEHAFRIFLPCSI